MTFIDPYTLAQINLGPSRLLLLTLAVLLYFVLLFPSLRYAALYLKAKTGWTRKHGHPPKAGFASWSDTASTIEKVTAVTIREEFECPYEYLLRIYGSNHFTNIVNILDPQLKLQDPNLFQLILEIMDAIHFGAILVDDVADNSVLRKGKLAAHRIYGSSETINRAYLRIFEVIEKCGRLRPSLIPYILDNLNQIHKGQ